MASTITLEEHVASLLNQLHENSPNLAPHPMLFTLPSDLLTKALSSISQQFIPGIYNGEIVKELSLEDKIIAECGTIKYCSCCQAKVEHDEDKKFLTQIYINSHEHKINLLGLRVLCINCFKIFDLDSLLKLCSAAISQPSPHNESQLSNLLKHYIRVNNLTLNQSYSFQNSLSIAFSLKILMKQINWTFECPYTNMKKFIESIYHSYLGKPHMVDYHK